MPVRSLPLRRVGGQCPEPCQRTRHATRRPTAERTRKPSEPGRGATIRRTDPLVAFGPVGASRRFLARPRPDHRRGGRSGGSGTSAAVVESRAPRARSSPTRSSTTCRPVWSPTATGSSTRSGTLPRSRRPRTGSSRPRCTRRCTPCSSRSRRGSGSTACSRSASSPRSSAPAPCSCSGCSAVASPATAWACIAALLAAVSPALWVNDTVLGLETLYGFLWSLALLALYRFWRHPGVWPLLGMAVALSLASLTRSGGDPALRPRRASPRCCSSPGSRGRAGSSSSARSRWSRSSIIGPWVVRNLTTFDEPTVLGTGFGWVLAYGNCDATYSGPLLGYWSDGCAPKDYPPGLEESRVDLIARKEAVKLHRAPPEPRPAGRGGPRRAGLGRVPAHAERAAQRVLRAARGTSPAGPCSSATT